MAYTPLATWVDGNVVLATDIQGNCDDAKKYLLKLENAAVEAGPWVETRHIVKGDYQNITNQAQMVSGVFGGQTHNHSEGLYTYATAYNTRVDNNGSAKAFVMDTTLTLEIFTDVVLFFQFWGNVYTPDPDSSVLGPAAQEDWADFFIYLDKKEASGLQLGTRTRSLLEDANPSPTHHVAPQLNGSARRLARQQISSFSLHRNLPAGVYNIGVATTSNAAKSRFTTWGVSIEAFYL